MPDCSHYRTQRVFVESREIQADRQVRGREVTTDWCEHQNSPLTKDIAGRVLYRLPCAGSLAGCTIPPDKQ